MVGFCFLIVFFFLCTGSHRDLHVRTHSFPTRRSSDLVTSDPALVRGAARVVLPGVGAFRACRDALAAVPGMIEAMEEAVLERGVPFLGICVGMQLLAERGDRKSTRLNSSH